MPHDTFWFF